MAEERVQRRLAAILAADVVGYSRMMGLDEAGTRARFNAHLQNLIEPAIADRKGRIVKTMGDGLLVEFTSVVDAVECAVAIQDGMKARNTDDPADKRIEFRIGVNLGDVIIEGDDIHGDGVNVAARLEALADPGGVCISGDVHRQCRGKIDVTFDVTFDDLGEQEVKNIAEPVRAFRLAKVKMASSAEPVSTRTDLPVVAILPFDNMSADAEQEYFSDGITEDLITALSRIRQIEVVARNSTFFYKGKSPNIRQVSEELGARYVVEGSVRKAGKRIRVTAQLIDGQTGNHIWAERYDREVTDIFDVQDELTETLVGAITPGIGSAERQRAKQSPPESLDTWNLYQRGMWHLHRRTLKGMNELLEARAFFEKAIGRDPEFGPAHAGYAETFYYNYMWGSLEADLETALKSARKAVELSGEDANAHVALGRIYRLIHNYDAEAAEYITALELNPSMAVAHYRLGTAFTFSGSLEKAVHHLETAIRLSPHDNLIGPFHARLGIAHFLQGNYEQAASLTLKATSMPSTQWPCFACLAAALGHLGRIDESKAALKDFMDIQPKASISFVRDNGERNAFYSVDLLLDGLRKAGLPE
ncbi:MAG: adenylate cyclase [Alphaproteobacteria bacterium]|jgi:adenylate cyclase